MYFNYWADEQKQQDADTMHRSRKMIFSPARLVLKGWERGVNIVIKCTFTTTTKCTRGHGWTEVEMDQFTVEDLCSIDGWYKYCQNTLSEHCTPFSRISNKQRLCLKLHLFSTPLPLPSTPISLSWLTGHQKSSLCLSLNTLPASLFPVPSHPFFHPLCQMQWDWMQLWLNAAI